MSDSTSHKVVLSSPFSLFSISSKLPIVPVSSVSADAFSRSSKLYSSAYLLIPGTPDYLIPHLPTKTPWFSHVTAASFLHTGTGTGTTISNLLSFPPHLLIIFLEARFDFPARR